MSYSDHELVDAIHDDLKFASVRFIQDSGRLSDKTYTYKYRTSCLTVKKDDSVIVQLRHLGSDQDNADVKDADVPMEERFATLNLNPRMAIVVNPDAPIPEYGNGKPTFYAWIVDVVHTATAEEHYFDELKAIQHLRLSRIKHRREQLREHLPKELLLTKQ